MDENIMKGNQFWFIYPKEQKTGHFHSVRSSNGRLLG